MRRYVDLTAFAVILMGALALGRPDAASATMLKPIIDGDDDLFRKCCKSTDGKQHCCYRSGCAITEEGCVQVK